MEYYIKTICTKTYFFVQQHCLVTVMISSMIHLNKRKKITGYFKVRWNWYTQFHRLDSHFNRFFSYFHRPVASWCFLSCHLYFLVFLWLSYTLPKTAMEILWKYKRRKNEISTGRVYWYFHWFCTSVFPKSNLMSSQMPIFDWLRDQTIKLISI